MLLAPGPTPGPGTTLRKEAQCPGRIHARGRPVTGIGMRGQSGSISGAWEKEHGKHQLSVLAVRERSTEFGQVVCEPEQVPIARNSAFFLDSEFRTGSAKSGGPERKGLGRAFFAHLRAGPVNRSAPKTAGNLRLMASLGSAESATLRETGGGSATGDEPSPCIDDDAVRQIVTRDQTERRLEKNSSAAQPSHGLLARHEPRE